jgi:hypothetical protein
MPCRPMAGQLGTVLLVLGSVVAALAALAWPQLQELLPGQARHGLSPHSAHGEGSTSKCPLVCPQRTQMRMCCAASGVRA